MRIREYRPGDESAICAIYNHYITNTVVTFEEVPLTPRDIKQRAEPTLETYPWYVCEVNDEVVGYAYATRFRERSAYRYTTETSVYIRNGFSRHGFGKALYSALLAALRARGFHTVVACIALPHESSVALHESFGFAKIAHFVEVGNKFDQWIDVGYWQRQFQ